MKILSVTTIAVVAVFAYVCHTVYVIYGVWNPATCPSNKGSRCLLPYKPTKENWNVSEQLHKVVCIIGLWGKQWGVWPVARTQEASKISQSIYRDIVAQKLRVGVLARNPTILIISWGIMRDGNHLNHIRVCSMHVCIKMHCIYIIRYLPYIIYAFLVFECVWLYHQSYVKNMDFISS